MLAGRLAAGEIDEDEIDEDEIDEDEIDEDEIDEDEYLSRLATLRGSNIARIGESSRETPLKRRVGRTSVNDCVSYDEAEDVSGRGSTADRSTAPLRATADVQLVHAIRTVAAGGQYVHPSPGAAPLGPQAAHPKLAGPGGELSEREQDVRRLVALALTNAEIGEQLYVSVRTVETHRAHMHQKLNLKTRAELVSFARDAGLLDEEGIE